MSDSAGRPFAGRAFEPNPWGADDGSAPPAFLAAHAGFAAGRTGPEPVLDALRDARLLVPLLAGLAEAGEGEHGTVDKQAELALPTVAGPDGRRVLPAFSSAPAMARWNPAARPVPAPARQVALGAAADGTELVIVDPGSPTQFGIRRGAGEALARGTAWTPSWLDPDVERAVAAAAAAAGANRVRLVPGDPGCTLSGPELRVVVDPGPGDARGPAVLERLRRALAADPVVRERVDSLALALAAG